MKKILLLGASGLVGRESLALALADERVCAVIAPTRRPLSPHTKLVNPISDDLASLLPLVRSWEIDGVLCALGTTIKKAGSKEAFRHVDYELPVEFGQAARAQGAATYSLVSAIGASPTSPFFYARTKGEVERDLSKIHFDSLTILRPLIISGERSESRFAENVTLDITRALRSILPKGLQANPATRIAQVLVDSAFTDSPGVRYVYSQNLV